MFRAPFQPSSPLPQPTAPRALLPSSPATNETLRPRNALLLRSSSAASRPHALVGAASITGAGLSTWKRAPKKGIRAESYDGDGRKTGQGLGMGWMGSPGRKRSKSKSKSKSSKVTSKASLGSHSTPKHSRPHSTHPTGSGPQSPSPSPSSSLPLSSLPDPDDSSAQYEPGSITPRPLDIPSPGVEPILKDKGLSQDVFGIKTFIEPNSTIIASHNLDTVDVSLSNPAEGGERLLESVEDFLVPLRYDPSTDPPSSTSGPQATTAGSGEMVDVTVPLNDPSRRSRSSATARQRTGSRTPVYKTSSQARAKIRERRSTPWKTTSIGQVVGGNELLEPSLVTDSAEEVTATPRGSGRGSNVVYLEHEGSGQIDVEPGLGDMSVEVARAAPHPPAMPAYHIENSPQPLPLNDQGIELDPSPAFSPSIFADADESRMRARVSHSFGAQHERPPESPITSIRHAISDQCRAIPGSPHYSVKPPVDSRRPVIMTAAPKGQKAVSSSPVTPPPYPYPPSASPLSFPPTPTPQQPSALLPEPELQAHTEHRQSAGGRAGLYAGRWRGREMLRRMTDGGAAEVQHLPESIRDDNDESAGGDGDGLHGRHGIKGLARQEEEQEVLPKEQVQKRQARIRHYQDLAENYHLRVELVLF